MINAESALSPNAIINASSLPAFTATDPSEYSDVFYAILKTNENFVSAVKQYHGPKRDGTFVGIGFGASFLCLSFFCQPTIERIILCDREPYVYLMGKIFLTLIERSTSIEEVLLSLVNYERFREIYRIIIESEDASSPLFLRKDKQTMLAGHPAEVDALREVIFTLKERVLPEADKTILSEASSGLVDEQRKWVQEFMKRAFYNIRVFGEDFSFFKNLTARIIPLCVDIFHPDFWDWLSAQPGWWAKPSMVYLSNAAVYSRGSDKRDDEVSTTRPYDPRILKQFQERTGARVQYVYSYQESYYMVSVDEDPPSLKEALS